MNRAEIVAALTALGAVLDSRGLRGEMYVVGGAAIALAFDTRRSTRDIGAVFEPKAAIYEAAAEVSQRLELPPGWLNDAVKGFLAGEIHMLRLSSTCLVFAVSRRRRQCCSR